MFTELEMGGGLRLVPVATADAAELFALIDANRAYLRQWLPWLDFNTEQSDSEEFIARSRSLAEAGTGAVFAIRSDDLLVGTIGFNEIDSMHRICEIGYWLGESYQGQGWITRSTTTLINFAFEELAMNKVCIPVATENRASRDVAERMGCIREGTARDAEWLYDRYVDHVLYSLLKSDWDSQRK